MFIQSPLSASMSSLPFHENFQRVLMSQFNVVRCQSFILHRIKGELIVDLYLFISFLQHSCHPSFVKYLVGGDVRRHNHSAVTLHHPGNLKWNIDVCSKGIVKVTWPSVPFGLESPRSLASCSLGGRPWRTSHRASHILDVPWRIPSGQSCRPWGS